MYRTSGMEERGVDEELRELIAKLVRIESENPPGNEAACARFIDQWFAERDVETTVVRAPYEQRPQVVASVGSGAPCVVLNGHMDVVPAGDVDDWQYPPYNPTIEDGRLYGRGAVDMKTGLALAMLTLARLREPLERDELDGTVVVQAAVGEEAAEPGTATLLENGYGGDFGVVLEPTGLQTVTSVKGCAYYEFEVRGESAHAGQPDDGTNAIERALPVLERLKAYGEAVREREDSLVGPEQATLTMLDAGVKENVVPDSVTISMDRRFTPAESAASIDAEIERMVTEITENLGSPVEWRRTRTYDSARSAADSELATVFRRRSNLVADVPSEEYGSVVATDMRNFVNDAAIPAITWGPGDVGQAHSTDECVDLAEAEAGLTILEQSVRDLLGTDGDG